MPRKILVFGTLVIAIVMISKSFFDVVQYFLEKDDSSFVVIVAIVNILFAVGLIIRHSLVLKIFLVYAYLMVLLSLSFYSMYLVNIEEYRFTDSVHLSLLATCAFWVIVAIFVRSAKNGKRGRGRNVLLVWGC